MREGFGTQGDVRPRTSASVKSLTQVCAAPIRRDAFALTTQKRKRDVWCPIMSTLAAEMATWERRPGPYLLQQNGKPFARKEFARQFAEARDAIPELKA